MFIGMGMFMAKDAYGAPPDLSDKMFSKVYAIGKMKMEQDTEYVED